MSGSSTTTLTVCTLNCWGLKFISKKRNQRMEAIADVFAASDYEIVCLQEVWVYDNYELIRDRTKRRFPYSKFFYSGVLGGGLAILSRYPILEIAHHPYRLNGRPLKFYHGDWYVGKGVGSAVIDHPVAGVIEVFTTHTVAGYSSNDEYHTQRVSQAWEISTLLKASAARGRNVIAMGDFNDEPGSLLHKLITQHGQMTDTWQSQHPMTPASQSTTEVTASPQDPLQKGATGDSPSNTWSNNKTSEGKRIDYVFYRKTSRFWCSGTRVVFTDVIPELKCSYSDHFGVEATFTLVSRDKNAVIPLSVWEAAAYESLQDLDPRTYQRLVDMFEQDLTDSVYSSRIQLAFFWLSLIIILGAIAIQAFIAFAILKAPSWVNIIIVVASGILGGFGTIVGLGGFLFGNYEQRGLKYFISEVQSYVEGKKAYDSKRTSNASRSESSNGRGTEHLIGADVKDPIY